MRARGKAGVAAAPGQTAWGAQVLAAPDVQKQLQALGAVGRASTPQQMAERMQADVAKWQAVIAKAGIARQ